MIVHFVQSDFRTCGHTCVQMIQAVYHPRGVISPLADYTHPDGMSVTEIRLEVMGQAFQITSQFSWLFWRKYPLILRCETPYPHYIVLWSKRGKMVHVSDPSQLADEWMTLEKLLQKKPTTLITIAKKISSLSVLSIIISSFITIIDATTLWVLSQGRGLLMSIVAIGASLVVRLLWYRHVKDEYDIDMQLKTFLGHPVKSPDKQNLTKMFHVKNARLYERTNSVLLKIQLVVTIFLLAYTVHWSILLSIGFIILCFYQIPIIKSTHSMNQLLHESSLMEHAFEQRDQKEVIAVFNRIQQHVKSLQRALYFFFALLLILPLGIWISIVASLDFSQLVNDANVSFGWYILIWYVSSVYGWLSREISPHSALPSGFAMV